MMNMNMNMNTTKGEEEAGEIIQEVCLPALLDSQENHKEAEPFQNNNHDDEKGEEEEKKSEGTFSRKGSKTLFISPLGRCSTKVLIPHSSLPEDDQVANHDYDHNHDKLQQQQAWGEGKMNTHHIDFQKLGVMLLDASKSCSDNGRYKRINAEQDVLSVYHESFLYGKVAHNTKVRGAIHSGFWSTNILRVESVAALFSLSLYVRATYTGQNRLWLVYAEYCCGFFFLVDYLIKIYSAPVRLYYMFSVSGFVDFITTLPIFFRLSGLLHARAVPLLLLMLRVLRAAPLVATMAFPGKAVNQEIMLLVAYTFGVVFMAAGFLRWVDIHAAREECGLYGCMNYWQSFYFMIVTISTVGYGDYSAKSDLGRLIVVCTILAALVFFPLQITKILELASRRPYGGKYSMGKVVSSHFIILSGNVSYRVVQEFLSEFYHPSHDQDMPVFPLHIVILAPFKPSFEMKTLLTHYKGNVDFIEGTPTKDSDLERVGARFASAFFLLADHHAKDPNTEDATQIMRSLSVHRFCGPKVRLIVEVLKPESQDNPIWDDAENDIEIVCPEAISYQLLARSCQIKGVSTFITNLFKSGLRIHDPRNGSWMQKYYHGMQQGIYPIILPSCFHEKKLLFREAVEIVYLKYKVILIGLDIKDGKERDVVLFPKDRIIEPSDVGLAIAKDLETAERVSKFCKSSKATSVTSWTMYCFKNFQYGDGIDDGILLNEVIKERHADISQRTKANQPPLDSVSDLINNGVGKLEKTKSGTGLVQYREMELLQIISGNAEGQSNLDLQNESSQSRHRRIKRFMTKRMSSLEDALDSAMSWPPVQKTQKPELPVLERQEDSILHNLKEQTISTIVCLEKPHVLVCMQGKWPINLFHFVSHLRKPSLPSPPIVILHPQNPSALEWGCVGMFPEVYFMRGSPIYELDLIRAGVLQADKVVILTQNQCRDDESQEEARCNSSSSLAAASSSVVVDVDNVVITATVEKLLEPKKGRVIVELHREIEMHYLRPKFRIESHQFNHKLYQRNRDAGYMFAPAYMEGKGICLAALNFLLYASYFNRKTLTIIKKMLFGEGGLVRLEQISVPKCYVGKMFEELFVDLIRKPQIEEFKMVLGLYRTDPSCSLVPYVYTNPLPHDVLHDGDYLYVLC